MPAYPGSGPRFPFQDDDVSEAELSVPLSLMGLHPQADESSTSRLMRSFTMRGNDYEDDDEEVSTSMGPSRQLTGSSAPMLTAMLGSPPLTDPYQRTRETLADVVRRLLETERVLGQHRSRPIPVPALVSARRRPLGHLAPNDEPPYPNQPANWGEHHEHFLWACRGAVPVITDHLQAIFQFIPPLLPSFVRAKLNNNAKRQIEFLQTYLPGESHSMQRAEARIVLWEAGLTDPEAQEGSQCMDIPQLSPTDSRYAKPRMPRGQPSFTNWLRMHDSYLLMFLGHHPNAFLRQSSWMFACQPTDQFISIRMSQLPFLSISAADINSAMVNLKEFNLQTGSTEEGILF